MDDQDTIDTGAATQDDTQDTAADTTDNGSSADTDTQDAGDQSEKLYAGKYKSPEDLERSYKELETKLGGYKNLEEKARAYDELSLASMRRTDPPKTAQDFVSSEGVVDWVGYNDYVQKTANDNATRVVREQIDVERAEKDFPFIAKDKVAAEAAIAYYQSGKAPSIYEAAQRLNQLRQGEADTARKDGAAQKEREIAQKISGRTERPSARTTDGQLTPESFAKLSLEQKRKVIEGFAQA